MANKLNLGKQSWVIILLIFVVPPIGLWLAWRSSWTRKSKAIATAIVATIITVITIGIINAPPIITVKSLKTDEIITAQNPEYRIEGRINPRDAHLTINGESVAVNSGGMFTKVIQLKEGKNSIKLVATDDNKSAEKTYIVNRLSAAEIASLDHQKETKEQGRKTNEAKAEDLSRNTANKHTQESEKQKPLAPPRFADYVNRPMADIAAEFDKNVDGTQFYAEKDGYKLFFENGPKFDNPADTTAEYTGKANIVNVELAEMGKCSQEQVFNKINTAMKLTGLNPARKGIRHEGMGGQQQGYGAYRDYDGDKSLELALLCDYDGDAYKLQIRVLPEYR